MKAEETRDFEKAEQIASKHSGLKGVYDGLMTAISMVKDSFKGRFKVPFWVIALILAAIAYLVNPVDAVPDVIPVAGLADDAAVIASMLAAISKVLEKYRVWKAGFSI